MIAPVPPCSAWPLRFAISGSTLSGDARAGLLPPGVPPGIGADQG